MPPYIYRNFTNTLAPPRLASILAARMNKGNRQTFVGIPPTCFINRLIFNYW